MALKLFGYTILSPSELADKAAATPSVVPPQNVKGAATVFEGGLGVFGGYSVDFDTYGAYTNEIDLINQYRDLSLQPEVDEAISDIMNELIVRDNDQLPVSITLGNLPDVYDEMFRQMIQDEFDHVMNMLDFRNRCYDIARQFYVDGRLYYDLIIDENNPRRGILEVRNIDPRMIRPVRELKQSMHQETGVRLTEIVDEYYVFSPQGFRNMTNVTHNTIGTRLTKDRIAYINSGIYTPGNTMVLSWLHKAIKPFNQLRMVEDATVIYRITRAPERRAFYIDVADLPTHRAEQYIQGVANRYRNRVVYDSTTGEVRDDRKVQSMLEDFFLPRRSNGRGTEIQTLPGGQNLGEIQDIDYFKMKLYRALNIPVSRIENGGGQFQMGRTTEIQRDEIKFSRFLNRLRTRISILFDEILERHLTLKGIIRTPQQWQELRKYVRYNFVTDSHFADLKELEVMKERLSVVQDADQYVGKYFSEDYIKSKILNLSSEEQNRIESDIKEKENPPETETGQTPEGGPAGEMGEASPAPGDLELPPSR